MRQGFREQNQDRKKWIMNNDLSHWKRFLEWFCQSDGTGISLDISRMGFDRSWWDTMQSSMANALVEMEKLESGAVANPDENRMVGHYWLRNPDIAPNDEIREKIRENLDSLHHFSERVLDGRIKPPNAKRFSRLLLIGIGGSALGPQLLYQALEGIPEKEKSLSGLETFFIDNTDPEGMARIYKKLGDSLKETLVLVISKSGGTVETRNGMLETRNAFKSKNLNFAGQAVAVTGEGSLLAQLAHSEEWLGVFPMWDWVGGRTSVTSAVGLLPALLQGIDIDAFLEGARIMDGHTRNPDIRKNPAAMLALMWHHAGSGRGDRAMVVLPYRDRLDYLARYLQQLVMESLGKEKDLMGKMVEQGLTVFGNKGSTDQHAYVQQLREGRSDFFATFIEVQEEGVEDSIEVEPGIHSGDFLQGFLLGTREALSEKKRPSLTLTLERLNAKTLGSLIALFERSVGLYAFLIGINAYHQPGVESGKKAAAEIVALKKNLFSILENEPAQNFSVEELAHITEKQDAADLIFSLLESLRMNGRIKGTSEAEPDLRRYSAKS